MKHVFSRRFYDDVHTEHAGVAITLETCILGLGGPGWNLARHTGYPDKIFHGFCQSFHWYAGIIRLGYDQFLLNPFHFTIHYHSSLYSLRYWQYVVSSTRIKRWRPPLPSSVYTVSLRYVNPLKPELNSICYLLALLAHHFLHISTIRVKSLTLRLLMSYLYIWSTYSWCF